MIDLGQARARVQQHLDQISSMPLIITDVEAFDHGWVFFYDSQQNQETGDFRDSLAGNAPFLVDRETGEIHQTGTGKPVEAYIREYAERKLRGT